MSATKGAILRRGFGVLGVHLVGIERFGIEQRVRDHVLFAAGVFDVRFEQLQIEQVGHAQAAASHFVFVSGADAARSGANLHASGSILGSQFDHAMVGQDHVGAIADEKVAIDLYAGFAQGRRLL